MKELNDFLDIRRFKNRVYKIGSRKYLASDPFCQFFPEHRVPDLHPELLSGAVASQLQQSSLI